MPQVLHNCVFAIGNYLPVPLKRQSYKSDRGAWDTMPIEEIPPMTQPKRKSFKLLEKKNLPGSGGWVIYRASFMGMEVLFTFWMERCTAGPGSIYSDLKVECNDFDVKKLIKWSVRILPEAEVTIAGNNHTIFNIELLKSPIFDKSFQSLVLQEPLFPVVDEDGRCPTYQNTNQVLAKSTGGCGAATFALSSSTSTRFLVKGHIDPILKKIGVDLVAKWPGMPEEALTEDVNNINIDQDGNFAVKVGFVPALVSDNVPWGYHGKVNWFVRIKPTGQLIPISSHDVEFYAVSPAAHSFLDITGIPISLLRFAVLPTRSNGKITSDYPGWIVHRIHYDSGFVYERISGANIYTVGRTFNLVAWLAAQKKNTKAAPWHINCFDLAGITGICMSLSFKDAKEALRLQRHYMKPFGYIVPSHLIGWDGETTSPITRDHEHTAPDPTLDRQVDIDYEKRHGFTCHVFLTWYGKVLDATAGPHKGTESLPDYIKNVIDRHGERERKVAGNLNSVQQTLSVLGHDGYMAESEQILYSDSGYSFRLYPLESIVKEITIDKIPNVTFDDLLPVLTHRCEPEYKITGEFFPVNMLPSDEGGTSLVWRMNVELGGKPGIIDLHITIFKSFSKTQAACAELLSSMGISTTNDNIVAIDKDKKCHLISTKTSCHASWIAGNHMLINLITTNVNAKDSMPIMKALNDILFDEMSNVSAKGGPKKLVCGMMKMKDPKHEEEVKCGTRIFATVDVDDWAEWDWEEGWGNAIVLDYIKPKEKENTWTFEIYARRPGIESITFKFVDRTYNREERVLTMYITE